MGQARERSRHGSDVIALHHASPSLSSFAYRIRKREPVTFLPTLARPRHTVQSAPNHPTVPVAPPRPPVVPASPCHSMQQRHRPDMLCRLFSAKRWARDVDLTNCPIVGRIGERVRQANAHRYVVCRMWSNLVANGRWQVRVGLYGTSRRYWVVAHIGVCPVKENNTYAMRTLQSQCPYNEL